jgi:glutaconyl-CoA/methylmalonyl-CoA decarboxylase subunit delta
MMENLLLSSNISTNTIIIALVGYLVVFTALFLLYILFKALPRLLYPKSRKKEKDRKGMEPINETHILGEETAAIAMAFYLFFDELHDEESGILTIKKTSKTYSPWSSKIYAVRNQFNRI